MSYSAEDVLEILRKARMDLTNAQGKLTDAMNGVAELAKQLPPPEPEQLCPVCGLGKPTERLLADHLRNVHDLDE